MEHETRFELATLTLARRRIGQTSCVLAQRPGMDVMVSPFGEPAAGACDASHQSAVMFYPKV